MAKTKDEIWSGVHDEALRRFSLIEGNLREAVEIAAELAETERRTVPSAGITNATLALSL